MMKNIMFQRAIVRPPGKSFDQGLTTAQLGSPDFELALTQHEQYCAALQKCGLELIRLDAQEGYPDATFVEDVAVLTGEAAILTNPGTHSRKGEVALIQPVVSRYYQRIYTITPPGTLDGGDICEAEGHFFIGISERTNEEGGRQLAEVLAKEGFTSSFVRIAVSGIPGILHLKSGIAYLGDNHLVLIDAFVGMPQFEKYDAIRVDEDENYAANCVRVNDYVLAPQGYPRMHQSLAQYGYQVLAVDMSEYRKMDGGLSCLSLRF
jgi:dimethylargininase